MGTASQVATSVTIISNLKGFQAVSLSAMETATAPTVLAGSVLEVAGAFFAWDTVETPNASSWTAIATASTAYLVCAPSGSAGSQILTSSYSDAAPTWVGSKCGWYASAASAVRAIARLYKSGTAVYDDKMLLLPSPWHPVVNTGKGNTKYGANALAANTTGDGNVAVGYQALLAGTGSVNNVAVGYQALLAITTGDCNVAVGKNALDNITTGGFNVGIGQLARASAVNVNNEVSIYSGLQYARFQSTAGAWSWVSDERDKTDIRDSVIGLDFLMRVPVKEYRWNLRKLYADRGIENDGSLAERKTTLGFTAQSLDKAEATLSEQIGLVVKTDPNAWTVAPTQLIPVLVNAVKELARRVAELEARR